MEWKISMKFRKHLCASTNNIQKLRDACCCITNFQVLNFTTFFKEIIKKCEEKILFKHPTCGNFSSATKLIYGALKYDRKKVNRMWVVKIFY